MSNSFVIGKGTKVKIALLPVGSRVTPKEVTITSAATETAKDITAPASINLSGALPAGTLIAAGNYLGFKAPTTGKVVTVQLSADAVAGDTDVDVVSIPEAIAANSVAEFPLRLSGRTNANLGRSGNRTSSVDFDSSGYADGLTTSIEQTITMNGNWLPLDPGFATAEYAFGELREVYLYLELPKISDAYSKGRVYDGPGSITSLPLEIAADGIITGNVEATFNGKPNYTPDKPV
jgi:hypothetical protein